MIVASVDMLSSPSHSCNITIGQNGVLLVRIPQRKCTEILATKAIQQTWALLETAILRSLGSRMLLLLKTFISTGCVPSANRFFPGGPAQLCTMQVHTKTDMHLDIKIYKLQTKHMNMKYGIIL